MTAPHTLELLADGIVRDRLAEARQARLAADLLGRRAVHPVARIGAVRHTLAVGLRHLATTLDPSLAARPAVRVARSAPR